MCIRDRQCDLHYQDGKTELDQIDYRIVTLLPCREESILRPAQAVQELYDGHSFYGEILEYYQVPQVTVLSCVLEWKAALSGRRGWSSHGAQAHLPLSSPGANAHQ